MYENRPQITLAGILLAITALCVVFAFWGREEILLVAPLAGAFIGSLITPFGMRFGLAIATLIVIVGGILVEKDPSGLGPTELVIAIHMVILALPAAASAWLGRSLRTWISPPIIPQP